MHLKCQDSREIIYPGKNADGWWNAEALIKQVRLKVHGEWNAKFNSG